MSETEALERKECLFCFRHSFAVPKSKLNQAAVEDVQSELDPVDANVV